MSIQFKVQMGTGDSHLVLLSAGLTGKGRQQRHLCVGVVTGGTWGACTTQPTPSHNAFAMFIL